MYEQQVIDLVKNSTAFLATVDGNRPHVRPMRPYVDKEGHIWLFGNAKTKQFEEIEQNPRVELCVLGADGEVVTIYGRLRAQTGVQKELTIQKGLVFADVPALKKYFSGPADPNLVYYRLGIHEVKFAQNGKLASTRVNLPQEFNPDIELSLCQGGFCLLE